MFICGVDALTTEQNRRKFKRKEADRLSREKRQHVESSSLGIEKGGENNNPHLELSDDSDENSDDFAPPKKRSTPVTGSRTNLVD